MTETRNRIPPWLSSIPDADAKEVVAAWKRVEDGLSEMCAARDWDREEREKTGGHDTDDTEDWECDDDHDDQWDFFFLKDVRCFFGGPCLLGTDHTVAALWDKLDCLNEEVETLMRVASVLKTAVGAKDRIYLKERARYQISHAAHQFLADLVEVAGAKSKKEQRTLLSARKKAEWTERLARFEESLRSYYATAAARIPKEEWSVVLPKAPPKAAARLAAAFREQSEKAAA